MPQSAAGSVTIIHVAGPLLEEAHSLQVFSQQIHGLPDVVGRCVSQSRVDIEAPTNLRTSQHRSRPYRSQLEVQIGRTGVGPFNIANKGPFGMLSIPSEPE